jgi:hypothetical protein
MDWNNKTNKKFYENLTSHAISDQFGKPAGLDTQVDVSILHEMGYFYEARTVLEIGAGDGRVIDGILKLTSAPDIHTHLGILKGRLIATQKIYALERCDNFVEYLNERFRNNPKVDVIKCDLLIDEIPRADLGLWMWSGIMEFSPEEQSKAIARIKERINELVIDLPLTNANSNLTSHNDRYGEIVTPSGTLHGYNPSINDLLNYALSSKSKENKAGEKLNLIPIKQYKTPSGRDRIMYSLK